MASPRRLHQKTNVVERYWCWPCISHAHFAAAALPTRLGPSDSLSLSQEAPSRAVRGRRRPRRGWFDDSMLRSERAVRPCQNPENLPRCQYSKYECRQGIDIGYQTSLIHTCGHRLIRRTVNRRTRDPYAESLVLRQPRDGEPRREPGRSSPSVPTPSLRLYPPKPAAATCPLASAHEASLGSSSSKGGTVGRVL